MSSVFGETCSGGGGRYLCKYVSKAVAHLNSIVRFLSATEAIITVVFRIQSESNCQEPLLYERNGYTYRVRFESGLSSGRGAIICGNGMKNLLSDQKSITSFEADSIGFTNVKLFLKNSPNSTFTNCFFSASSIRLGSFDAYDQMIKVPRKNTVLILKQVEIPPGSKFRVANYDSIYFDNVYFQKDRPDYSPSFIGNSRLLQITSSTLRTKLYIDVVDDILISECKTGDHSVISIIQANDIRIDHVDYIGDFFTGIPVLYIGYSVNTYITNSKISMGTNWLFISSLIYLLIENVEIYNSQTQGSMLFVSTCKTVEVRKLYCNDVQATCLHLQDIPFFQLIESEFNNVASNIYNGAFRYTLSYDTIIPSNDLSILSNLILNSRFVNCSGSSVFVETSSSLEIQGSDFYYNSGPKGGAIYYEFTVPISEPITRNKLNIYKSTFIGNGMDKSYGGAIFTQGFCLITNSYFENNRAEKGGVIFVADDKNVQVTLARGNIFIGNKAKFGKIGYSEIPSNTSIVISEEYYYDEYDSISSPCFNFTYTMKEVEQISNTHHNETHTWAFLGQSFMIDIEARNIFDKLITTPKGAISLKINNDRIFLKPDYTKSSNFTIYFSLYSNIEVKELTDLILTVEYEKASYETFIVLTPCPNLYRYDSPGCVNIFYIIPLVTSVVSVTLIATCIAMVGICVARYKSKLLRKRTQAEQEMEKVLLDKKIIFEESEEKPTSKASFIIPTEDITIQKRIGEGGQSMVYKGLWKGIEVAIKSIKDQEDEDVFEREGALLISLRHPNIVIMYGFCVPNNSQKYMVIEYMKGGSLDKLIFECKSGRQRMKFNEKLDILMELSRGMSYLHSLKVIHRDLKPANVLLDEKNSVKICDFGMSRVVGASNFQTSMTLNIGTLLYCPPENFDSLPSNDDLHGNQFSGLSNQTTNNESIYYSNDSKSSSSIGNSSYSKEDRLKNASKIDVYSFGIIMWSLFFEEIPYTTFNHKKMNYFTEVIDCNSLTVITQIVRGKRPTIPFANDEQLKEWTTTFMQPKEKRKIDNSFNEGVSKYIKLMQQCWHQLPQERPSFEDIIQDLYETSGLCSDPLFM